MYDSLIKGKWWYGLSFLLVPAFLAHAHEEVYLGTMRLGSVTGEVVFPVYSNVQELNLQAVATDLYKDSVPTSAFKIPVNFPGGARVRCEYGSQVGGGTGLLAWLATTPPDMLPAGWTGAVSEIGAFDSGQPDKFEQRVWVTVQWDQSDPELPMGGYYGQVGLAAGIAPGPMGPAFLVPVYVEVLGMIAVATPMPVVSLGSVAPGQIPAQVTFRIDSNLQDLDLQVSATHLYKGGSPTSTQVIEVAGSGARVEPQNGNETSGGMDNFLEWGPVWTGPDSLLGRETVVSTFESGQVNRFSQDVTVSLEWNPAAAHLATGEYSGYVRLVGSHERALDTEAKVLVTVDIQGDPQPVARIEGERTVAIGEVVSLDGSASSSPGGGPLTYAWSLVSAPSGSGSVLSSPTAAQIKFVPDLVGSYVVRLIVNDGVLDSEPAFATITAEARKRAVRDTLDQTQTDVAALPVSALKNRDSAVVLVDKIDTTMVLVENDHYRGALNKLENDVLKKMDGCALTGAPDKNDWIVTREAQAQVYPQVQRAVALLRQLLEE